jgi:hypothetical protein
VAGGPGRHHVVFGLRTLAEIEKAFPGRLDDVLIAHFTR